MCPSACHSQRTWPVLDVELLDHAVRDGAVRRAADAREVRRTSTETQSISAVPCGVSWNSCRSAAVAVAGVHEARSAGRSGRGSRQSRHPVSSPATT